MEYCLILKGGLSLVSSQMSAVSKIKFKISVSTKWEFKKIRIIMLDIKMYKSAL